jgi:hypothetical protein
VLRLAAATPGTASARILVERNGKPWAPKARSPSVAAMRFRSAQGRQP